MSPDVNPSPPPDGGPVELSVPLHPRHAATVRTIAATLGADAGFSVDELDDIRLALSEAFSALADTAGAHSRATVSFAVGDRTARIELRVAADTAGIDLDELALGILRSVTDDFVVTSDSIVLVKHATETSADRSSS